MSEVLLEAILEKLQSLEIASLNDNNPAKDEAIQSLLKEVRVFQTEMAKWPLQFKIISEKNNELLKNIIALNFRLDNPFPEQIKHSHHLHKEVWIAIGLFIVSLLILYGWINCINTKKTFEANDIKYRFLNAIDNPALLKILLQTDSLYNMDKDSFAKRVVIKEQILEQRAKQFRLADEKKKDGERFINKSRKSSINK